MAWKCVGWILRSVHKLICHQDRRWPCDSSQVSKQHGESTSLLLFAVMQDFQAQAPHELWITHSVGRLYTKPASVRSESCVWTLRREYSHVQACSFLHQYYFPKKSLFAEFLIERGSWFHSKVCQNHVSWTLLPPLEVTASSPPNRSRVERKHLSTKPTTILGFETAAILDLQESFRRRKKSLAITQLAECLLQHALNSIPALHKPSMWLSEGRGRREGAQSQSLLCSKFKASLGYLKARERKRGERQRGEGTG